MSHGVGMEGWSLSYKNKVKTTVSSRGFSERNESMSGGLELWLTGIEWWRLRSSRSGDGRGKKKASLLHGAPFIGGRDRGCGEGPQTSRPCHHR
jgi:hypothetical protein